MKRVLFLMSDTGGGHRAAAEAIRDALVERCGAEHIDSEMVDVFKQMRYPSNAMPEFYPWIVTNGKPLWRLAYNVSEIASLSRAYSHYLYLTNRDRLLAMVRKHPADLVVGVHSVTLQASVNAYSELPGRPPLITVVTDLVSTPLLWYDPRVDECHVPTQAAFDRGLRMGLRPDQMHITGLPVHPRFARALTDKPSARAALNWQPDLPTVLIVAGGDGTGPVFETAQAIVSQVEHCQLAVVTGRNKTLKERLDAAAQHWRAAAPVHIYGYVTNMPQLMAASDILVSKAGPATICEACIAGLPIILNNAIPGQENGNIDYVVQNKVGVFAPGPHNVASAVSQWLAEGEAAMRARSERARQIARPDAVWHIVDRLQRYLGIEP